MNNDVYIKQNLTKNQKQYIVEHYATMPTDKIAERIKASKNSIHYYASYKGLVKSPYGRLTWGFVKEYRNRKEYDYKQYINQTEELKVEELYKSKYGRYHINQHYFDVIDNEFKAYWLGFLYADGCVRKTIKNNKQVNSVSLSLCGEDTAHIKKFLDSLQSDANISCEKTKLNDKTYDVSRTRICNQQIVDSLIKLGCVPNKTFILTLPTFEQVPENLYRHFIRGFFDGDGHIHINIENKTINCGFTGTKNFISSLQNYLCDNIEFLSKNKIVYKNDNVCTIHWGSLIDVYRIFVYLYKDCNIFLDRKFEKFNKIFWLDT